MKYIKTMSLIGVAISALTFGTAQAEHNVFHTNNFTSHHLVDEKPYKDYAEQLPAEAKIELREYLNYEHREPCQNYQEPPTGFVKDGCKLVPANMERTQEVVDVTILKEYTINFAFDSDDIDASERAVVDRIANEIRRYNPSDVLVAGHTDTSGSHAYNAGLSKRRADAVSMELTHMGVTNRIIDERAYGETQPAVETGDGVKLRANRRVTVQFIK